MDKHKRNEHKKRHLDLHASLDELVADMITHTKKRLGSTTVLELISWSKKQTLNPTDKLEVE